MVEFLAGLLFGVLVTMITLSAVGIQTTGYWEHQAILHQAAHYDSQTGAFTWDK